VGRSASSVERGASSVKRGAYLRFLWRFVLHVSKHKRPRPTGTRACAASRGTTQFDRTCRSSQAPTASGTLRRVAAIGCPGNGGLTGADYFSWWLGAGGQGLLYPHGGIIRDAPVTHCSLPVTCYFPRRLRSELQRASPGRGFQPIPGHAGRGQ
jgi:hypothetical protein